MSAPFEHNDNPRLLPSLVVGGVAWAVFADAGPLTYGPHLNPVAVISGGVAVAATGKLLIASLRLVERYADWKHVNAPRGNSGTAGFITKLKDLKHELIPKGWGPYWGVFRGKPIFADLQSSALIIGPSGTGKSTKSVIPLILSIRKSKIVLDFKGELACVTRKALLKRGETVRILNLGDLYADILGQSDSYNILHNIVDDLHRPGGINDVTSDISELNYKLLEEPSQNGGSADNIHFRDGSRTLIGGQVLIQILINGYEATLGDVQLALNDRAQMLKDALWVAGKLQDKDGNLIPAMPLEKAPWARHHDSEDIKRFCRYVRAVAASIAEILLDTETDESRSFITGARQALAPFNMATRTHRVTSRSTFRFKNLKKSNTTVFIIVDASRITEQAKVADLVQWAATIEIKRAEDKHTQVYFIADEANNYRIDPNFLSWGRSYGWITFIFIQSRAAFIAKYSEYDFSILWSETEIKLIMPGVKEPELLELLEIQLGTTPIMTQNSQGQRSSGTWHLDGYGIQEDGRPLQTQDELRRSQKGIVIIRGNRPAEVDLPPYAATEPFRSQVDDNPHYGKPYLLPVELDLRSRDGRFLTRIWRRLTETFKIRKGDLS